MLASTNYWLPLVLSLLLVASSYSSSLKLKGFSRTNGRPSCSTSLSSADLARLGEDGEVCVDLSTTPFDRRRHPDLPEVLGSACATLNEDRDQLEVKFQILGGVGGDFALKRTQGGVYAWKSQIPRNTFRAYKKSVWHVGHVEEATMSFDLTTVRRDCCSEGILIVLRAIVYRKSNPRSRFFLYPAEDDSGTCTRKHGSRVRMCELDVSCEEDECDTCVRTSCPDTTSSVGPIVCDIINQCVDSECTLYGDPGTWQLGTVGNQCVCEFNAAPAPCIIDGEDGEIFPGDSCTSATNSDAIAIRTSASGECTCEVPAEAALCDNRETSGAECLSSSGAPGVVVNIGDIDGDVECVCAVPCEYLTNPVSNPSAVAVGHIGQECSVELPGYDVTPQGVLVEMNQGTCSCQPLDTVLEVECEYEEIDRDGDISEDDGTVYESCDIGGNFRGILIPTDANPAVCDCVPKDSCQCPLGQTCQYAGMQPGDSCVTEFGTGFLAQRADSLGCNCRINCELVPCTGSDCDNFTFGSCDISGVEGIVVPTTEAGECACALCDEGQCGYPDLGCIDEGSSCTDNAGRADVLLRDAETRCTCGCDLSIPFLPVRRSTAGKACSFGLATGVVVTGSFTGTCGCQVQNCTSSNCQGPDCETFDGIIGETCDSETGIIRILPDGSCKCQQLCETFNCGDGPQICVEPEEITSVAVNDDGHITAGDVCVSGTGPGVLQPSSDVDGECDCVPTTCAFSTEVIVEGTVINSRISSGDPGDACTSAGALGVLTDSGTGSCTCELSSNEGCTEAGCFSTYGPCVSSLGNVPINAQCITSSELIGTYKLVSGSNEFCECVASD